MRKWQHQTFPSARSNCADSRDEGGTSDDGGPANGLGRRRNSGCWCRLDFGADLRVDVRPVNFRPVNRGANHSRRNSARYNAAGINNAGNGRANPGYCGSDAGNRNSRNHPEHHPDADSADGA